MGRPGNILFINGTKMDYTLIINNLSAHGGIKKEEIESFTSLLEEVEISKKGFPIAHR